MNSGERTTETVIARVEPAAFQVDVGEKFSWVTTTTLGVVGTSWPEEKLVLGSRVRISKNPDGLPEIVSIQLPLEITI